MARDYTKIKRRFENTGKVNFLCRKVLGLKSSV